MIFWEHTNTSSRSSSEVLETVTWEQIRSSPECCSGGRWAVSLLRSAFTAEEDAGGDGQDAAGGFVIEPGGGRGSRSLNQVEGWKNWADGPLYRVLVDSCGWMEREGV